MLIVLKKYYNDALFFYKFIEPEILLEASGFS